MKLKKLMCGVLALCLTLSMASCAKNDEGSTTSTSSYSGGSVSKGEDASNDVYFNIAALKGPTAMGLAKLIDDSNSGEDVSGAYNFTLAGSADEITPGLIKGEFDMACVPANLASVLYNRTEGEIVTLAVNTLGVLYIVEKGGSVVNLTDLAGKTLVAAGKGSTPEYALRYLLEQNDMNPDADVNIEWKNEHSECVASLASGEASLALLPQPFVTVAQGKIEGLRIASDLTENWDQLENGSSLITGVIVARKEVVEANPEAVSAFLNDYENSVSFVNENVDEASEIIGSLDIVEAQIAKKAIPFCNIVCIKGDELKEKLSGYLEVLFNANPESVGGKLPEDDFYFAN